MRAELDTAVTPSLFRHSSTVIIVIKRVSLLIISSISLYAVITGLCETIATFGTKTSDRDILFTAALHSLLTLGGVFIIILLQNTVPVFFDFIEHAV